MHIHINKTLHCHTSWRLVPTTGRPSSIHELLVSLTPHSGHMMAEWERQEVMAARAASSWTDVQWRVQAMMMH